MAANLVRSVLHSNTPSAGIVPVGRGRRRLFVHPASQMPIANGVAAGGPADEERRSISEPGTVR
jgi:hypothetical protein